MKKEVAEEIILLSEELLDGSITRSNLARLEEFIEESSQAMDLYLQVSYDTATLPEALGQTALQTQHKVTPLVRYPSRKKSLGFVAVAALVLLSCFSWHQLSVKPNPLSPSVTFSQNAENHFAKVSGAVGILWPSKTQRYRPGDTVPKETVTFQQGALEITLNNGILLLIEGPASFRIQDTMNMQLHYGNLVAHVPKEGRGFRVQHNEHTLIDHGTVFGMRVPQEAEQWPMEVAVFQGEVELLPASRSDSLRLGRYDAVIFDENSDTGVFSIPLDQEKFLKELPHPEMPWEMPPIPRGKETKLEFDVSKLIRGPGKFFSVFRWMKGRDALTTFDVELLLNGEVISRDDHIGRTGLLQHTQNNVYWFTIPESKYRTGTWTLRTKAFCPISTEEQPTKVLVHDEEELSDSCGILHFDDSLHLPMPDDSLLGKWRYMHDGIEYEREFLPDGKAYIRNSNFSNSKLFGAEKAVWWIEENLIFMHFPKKDRTERHLLRSGALFFIDRPYRNAHKVVK